MIGKRRKIPRNTRRFEKPAIILTDNESEWYGILPFEFYIT
jgi:hypothetical protein